MPKRTRESEVATPSDACLSVTHKRSAWKLQWRRKLKRARRRAQEAAPGAPEAPAERAESAPTVPSIDLNADFEADAVSAGPPRRDPALSRLDDSDRRVFVGNLPFSVDEPALRQLFAACGDVEHIQWLYDRASGRFYGTGFVRFYTPQAASQAVAMSGCPLQGRRIKIAMAPSKPQSAQAAASGGAAEMPAPAPARVVPPASRRKPRPPNCCTLFVGQLPFDTSEEEVRGVFGAFGAVKDVRWLKDRLTGEFRGCAFVQFDTAEPVDAALEGAPPELRGRPVQLDYAG